MALERSYDPIWDEIYGEGRHLVRYPYDSVVVFVNRHAPKDRPRSEIRVLEVGCGPGNNVWFAAREGFSVAGIDASPAAIEYARKRLAGEGLPADLRVGDFTALPFESESFDLAIDRGGIVCAGLSAGYQAVNEIQRVLRPGGKFHFNPFSTRHTTYEFSDAGPDGTRINLRGGNLVGINQICLYSRAEVDTALANGWKILTLDHLETVNHADPALPVHAEWRIIAEKTTAS